MIGKIFFKHENRISNIILQGDHIEVDRDVNMKVFIKNLGMAVVDIQLI